MEELMINKTQKERVKKGICVECGVSPAAPNVQRCHPCGAKDSARTAATRYRKIGEPKKAIAVWARYENEVRLGRH